MTVPPKKVIPKAPPKPQPPPPQKLPMERMLVVFDYNTKGRIIFCQGETIEPNAREETALEFQGIPYPEAARPGKVLVYEVEPVLSVAEGPDGSSTVSYVDGAWREAKAMFEMAAFHTGNFLGIWKDIPHGIEYTAMHQRDIEEVDRRTREEHEAKLAERSH